MQRFYVNDFRKWLNKLRKSQWQLKAIVCLQSLVHDRSQLWIASNSSLCLGRAHSIWLTSSVFPRNIPYWVLSVPELWERWIRGAVPVWWFVCWRNVEGDDGLCPRSSEPRDNRSSRADSILALPLCSALLSQSFLTRPGACAPAASWRAAFCWRLLGIAEGQSRCCLFLFLS